MPVTASAANPRQLAFCAADAPEVFASVVQPQSIWTADPLDVEAIHADAREAFARAFHKATAGRAGGAVQLILGPAGCGKTHLMRAFRHYAHERGGYCAYLQMTSHATDYGRYVLSHVIDDLQQPYRMPDPAPGLTRLARGLLDSLSELVSHDERQQFCDALLSGPEITQQAFRLADFAAQLGRFDARDLDLLRALLFLLPNDGRLRARVIKWFRCEPLTPADSELLGGLSSWPAEDAQRLLKGLARVMAAAQQAPFVLLVDQLEETRDMSADEAETGRRFRQAVDALVTVAANIPSAVVVIACLEDYYELSKQHLNRAKLDRLEYDPPKVALTANRDEAEIAAVLELRLQHLFAATECPLDDARPLDPFTAAHLRAQSGKTLRQVLQWFHGQQAKCLAAGGWLEPDDGGLVTLPFAPASGHGTDLGRAWSDFLAAAPSPDLDDETTTAALLAWAAQELSAELPARAHIGTSIAGRFVEAELHRPDNTVDKLLLAVCDKDPRGGGLQKQVEEAATRAGELPTVFLRSSSFPTTPAAKVVKELLKHIAPKGKGRRVVIEPGDWRALSAYRAFAERHRASPGYAAWRGSGQPLSLLPSLRAIFALDKLPLAAAPRPTPPAAIPPPTAPPPPPPGTLRLGHARGVVGQPITLEPRELTQHMAFLGGSGSGKTTAALTIIEQLLAAGVPALLLDRKGDLARYADPDAWAPTDERTEQRAELRAQLDIDLFTPGLSRGRPLALPVVPPDLDQVPADERSQLAGLAARSLWAMMGGKLSAQDPKLAILGKAIEVLARVANRPATLTDLRRLVAEQDDALLAEVNGFEAKHFAKLAEALLSFELQYKWMFEKGDPLDGDRLFGTGAFARPGRTRLCIVNIQALGAATDFWVAQLLIALSRWSSRRPVADRLQAVALFDEADLYLPATRMPATKPPMEHLLKRARSAGLGLFLATQSPGDFDYKCRDQIKTWLIGRVKEATAIAKLKPLLEGRPDAAGKLATQGTGQFFLARETGVVAVETRPSLIATSQLPEERIAALAAGVS